MSGEKSAEPEIGVNTVCDDNEEEGEWVRGRMREAGAAHQVRLCCVLCAVWPCARGTEPSECRMCT